MGALWVREDIAIMKSTSHEIHGWGWHPHFQSLYHCNTSADRLVLLIFGTVFDHITADTLPVFNAKGSKVKVKW